MNVEEKAALKKAEEAFNGLKDLGFTIKGFRPEENTYWSGGRGMRCMSIHATAIKMIPDWDSEGV
jgi:hypothetical protein